MLIKSNRDIAQIKKGGKLLGEILDALAKMAQPGVSTGAIDAAAEKMIKKAGGRPSFKGYKSKADGLPFPSAICASANQELVHGIASEDVILDNGDILSVDIGMEWPYAKSKIPARGGSALGGKYQKSKIDNLSLRGSPVRLRRTDDRSNPPVIRRGLFTDTAITVIVGDVPEETKELLRVTREALEVGMRAVKPGNSVASIGKAIEDFVNSQGKYGIVRDLVGHGVGHEVHEEPRIPNFYDPKLEAFIMKPGMVLALEPMISLGGYKIKTGVDGWTIEMADGSLCAHFEHTVIVTERGCLVATRRPSEGV